MKRKTVGEMGTVAGKVQHVTVPPNMTETEAGHIMLRVSRGGRHGEILTFHFKGQLDLGFAILCKKNGRFTISCRLGLTLHQAMCRKDLITIELALPPGQVYSA